MAVCGDAVTTLLLTSPIFARHQTPQGHPERSERMDVLDALFAEARFSGLQRAESPRALLEAATLAHSGNYVDRIAAQAPQHGLVGLDPDTVMSPATLDAALTALGGAMQAVDAVLSGKARNAFCQQRPPGHHAETSTAMGFCLFNTAVVAARHARKHHGVGRVAIFDWDVHHGNGSQEILWADPAVLYASTHEMPLYPGTGEADDRGEHGQIVNVPLQAGDDGRVFLTAIRERVIPAIEAFAPELLIISAGFDAHRRDPLANLMLEASDFAEATTLLMDLAGRRFDGRIVSLLEGGYDLVGLSQSAGAHVERLMQG
jgi:acetoin utilization deacetylase AcuC-like enzyme